MKYNLLVLILFVCQLCIGQSPIIEDFNIHHPIVAKNGMVASQHELATAVGVEILKKGGNAVDAAVAVGFALAVVLPRAGNIGGGGFMLIHLNKQNITTAIDYRETAPAKSSREMFQDKQGTVDDDLFNNSALSIGIPGTVAGLIYALEKYGTMSLKEVIKPAIKLAEDGFPMTYNLARILESNDERLRKNKSFEVIFYKGEDSYKFEDHFIQKDLALSLKKICKDGKKAFYEGQIADKIVAEMKRKGGFISKEDLKNYTVREMNPVKGTYRGYEIMSMPPPSSGGVHIIQMLNILEKSGIDTLEQNSAESLHLLVETMRLAFADRSKHLGDPEFWNVPMQGLVSKEYADKLRKKINRKIANKSSDILPGSPQDYESEETTHFSVADKFGNLVSNTYTLNFSFGSGIVATGTGIILNNEMGDFSPKPGVPDAYGLVSGEANAIAPNKRPLSSMTPTIVLKDGKPFMATGSPGGSRIISTVLQTIVNVIDFDLNIAEAAHAPKIHHQWLPDILYYEKTLSPDTRFMLSLKGHTLRLREGMGSTQSIMIHEGLFLGASDPRRPDALTSGF